MRSHVNGRSRAVCRREMVNDSSTPTRQAFLFDLDGTLIDSVYQHVLAWREALEAGGIHLAVWRIHRQIGMSGGLFVNALARETGKTTSRPKKLKKIHQVHGEAFKRYASQVRPLPGASELLAYLTRAGVPWAIATSGRFQSASLSFASAGNRRSRFQSSRAIWSGPRETRSGSVSGGG